MALGTNELMCHVYYVWIGFSKRHVHDFLSGTDSILNFLPVQKRNFFHLFFLLNYKNTVQTFKKKLKKKNSKMSTKSGIPVTRIHVSVCVKLILNFSVYLTFYSINVSFGMQLSFIHLYNIFFPVKIEPSLSILFMTPLLQRLNKKKKLSQIKSWPLHEIWYLIECKLHLA